MDNQFTFNRKDTSDSEVELEIKITKEAFKEEKERVYKKLSADVSVPGFRPGKGPRNVIEAKLGTQLYDETLNTLIPKVTLEVLEKEKLVPLTQIKYSISKVSDEDGLEYKASFVILPKIDLADFSKIKVDKEKVEVSDKELDETIQQLINITKSRKSQTHDHKHEDGHDHDHDHDHDHETESKQKEDKTADKKEAKAELTDESVKQLGLGFSTVLELKTEVKKQIQREKEISSESKRLEKMIDEAIKMSKVKAPASIIDEEISRRESDYRARVKELGLEFEDFLKSQNTSIEKLKEEWKSETEKKVAADLLFLEIARVNNITVSSEEVNNEIKHITDPKLRAEYDSERGRRYITSVIMQQKAIHWLKEKVDPKPIVVTP